MHFEISRRAGTFALVLALAVLICAGARMGALNVLDVAAGKLYAGQNGSEANISDGLQTRADSDMTAVSPVRGRNNYPIRLALGPDGRIYVSDAKADAVFIYDAALNPVGQISGIAQPLGVGVAPNGDVYVGSDARDRVEVHDANGRRIQTIGVGTIKMPNDLVVDRDGRLYVADSLSHKVWIFDPNGVLAGSAGTEGNGSGQLDFPVAIAIAYRATGSSEAGELYVADQRQGKIHVFDLHGVFLRAYGSRVSRLAAWRGGFVRLQSLAFDAQGRLHAADCFMNNVQILDPVTGAYIDSYGQYGTAEGQLNLPLDILIAGSKVIAANAGNKRVEAIHFLP